MNFKVKNRHRLKDKDSRQILKEIKQNFESINFKQNLIIEIGEVNGINFIFINGDPCFFYHGKKIIFTLNGLDKFTPINKFVIVDMGAVKFVTNGADVMAPGIVDADNEIVENDQVWICDKLNRKPLAVGIALISGEQMVKTNKGKAINVIHHVGDSIWNFVAKSL